MTDADPTPRSEHWPEIARRWQQVGPPLRPSPQDLAFVSEALRLGLAGRRRAQALILGVTPELFKLAWPDATTLRAVDNTQAMIDALWPGPREAVLCADWRDVPLAKAGCDFVVCDGGLHLLPFPEGQRALVKEMARILVPGGRCCFRLFATPPAQESADQVFADLSAGAVGNMNELKLRLAMALQTSSVEGVELARVYDAFRRAVPNDTLLEREQAWPAAQIAVIGTYKHSKKRYHFVSVEQATQLFCDTPGGFSLEQLNTPTYALGQRCPSLIFRRS
jgi:SAM-dependent methyltransferase